MQTRGHSCGRGAFPPDLKRAVPELLVDLTGLVPESPSLGDAQAALHTIRQTFQTFCFADAESVFDTAFGMDVVDINRPPGQDEAAFLNALLTAVCRASIPLAPGVLIRAAPVSGAGAGKGLLARCISLIAFGREPHAVTGGSNREEREKRITAELLQGGVGQSRAGLCPRWSSIRASYSHVLAS